jgi:UDP-N-acetylenolpyruvoylglucosamine reductase
VEVTIFDMASDEIKTISMPELEFGYRHSLLKEKIHWFVVDMIFRTDLISNDTTDPRTFRSGKQPTGFTCGSFFRNPP